MSLAKAASCPEGSELRLRSPGCCGPQAGLGRGQPGLARTLLGFRLGGPRVHDLGCRSWSSRNFSPRPQAYHRNGSACKASTRQKEPPGRAWEPWGGGGSAAGRCGQSLRRQGWGRRGQILILERMLKAAAWQAFGRCSQCAGAEGHDLPLPSSSLPSYRLHSCAPSLSPTSLSQQPHVPMTLGAGSVGQRMLTAL